ncbi:MAG: Nif3-like dinuclear metal center hexameric protein [Proteobacteria bacterium]|nr:Nif3-like dinuclear metal center hexameric protein [Pseudomonadota bacterium]
MVTVCDIRGMVCQKFPEKCAESWDNPGLQLGRGDARVNRVLTALELTPAVVAEAISWGAQLVLTHHPFIFKPIKVMNDDTPEGRMLLDLAEHKIALLAAHTNLDSAPHAIAEKLADDLELCNRKPFLSHEPYATYKIVVFVPKTDAETVAQAMHAKGAGCVGQYTNVSFRGCGTGHFTCGQGSHPAIGTPGTSETVEEIRLEMVVSERDLRAVTRALHQAHPYEEPAFDVFKLESEVHGLTDLYGFGMEGDLPAPMTLRALIAHIKQIWDIPSLRAAGNADQMVSRVAFVNGAGAKFISNARGIDALITGDCGHHDFDNAIRRGIALIDAGHYETEKYIPQILAQTLMDSAFGNELEVQIAREMRNPFEVY